MIFCVEDDSNIRELVIYTLETTGFKARGFEDGKEFLEARALETPELILLDIMLPGMDGLELLSKLKASPKNRDIPVIMLTAKGAGYDKVKALDAGGRRLRDQTIWNDGACIQDQSSPSKNTERYTGSTGRHCSW